MSNGEKILVGKIVAAQGMRGELRVQTFTEYPSDLENFPALKIKFIRAAGQNLGIYRMEGIDNRTDAENLRGTELFINRADLPALKKGEHYITDLIGMKLITNDKRRVVYVHNFGAGDILELDNGDMIGFNGAVVDYEKKEIKYGKK